MIELFMAFMAVALLCAGYAFKKSWILWLDIPFWIVLSIYIAYNETWFALTAQHSLILIGVGATFGLGYSAIRMMSKPAIAKSGLDDDADEDDSDLMEYQRDRAQYDKLSKTYSSRKNRR